MKSTWKTFITVYSETLHPGLATLVRKKVFFFNSLPTILGLNKSGGWEAKLSLIKDRKELVLHPNTLPGIFYRWMALGSRGEGEGGTPDLE